MKKFEITYRLLSSYEKTIIEADQAMPDERDNLLLKIRIEGGKRETKAGFRSNEWIKFIEVE